MGEPVAGDTAKWDGELWEVVDYDAPTDKVLLWNGEQETWVRFASLSWVRHPKVHARARLT